jgi:hypothetical protein
VTTGGTVSNVRMVMNLIGGEIAREKRTDFEI